MMKRIKTYIQTNLSEAIHRLLQKVLNNGMPAVEAKPVVGYSRPGRRHSLHTRGGHAKRVRGRW